MLNRRNRKRSARAQECRRGRPVVMLVRLAVPPVIAGAIAEEAAPAPGALHGEVVSVSATRITDKPEPSREVPARPR